MMFKGRSCLFIELLACLLYLFARLDDEGVLFCNKLFVLFSIVVELWLLKMPISGDTLFLFKTVSVVFG